MATGKGGEWCRSRRKSRTAWSRSSSVSATRPPLPWNPILKVGTSRASVSVHLWHLCCAGCPFGHKRGPVHDRLLPCPSRNLQTIFIVDECRSGVGAGGRPEHVQEQDPAHPVRLSGADARKVLHLRHARRTSQRQKLQLWRRGISLCIVLM